MSQNLSRKLVGLALVLVIGLAALGVRLSFALQHAVGDDEPTYLTSALNYTNFLRDGKYRQLAWHEENYQHPVLSKIVYGVVLLTQPPLDRMHNKYFTTGLPILSAQGRPWAMAARYTSVIIGVISCIVIALVDPLAGLFFATQSLVAISTSLIGLEALPLLTSFLAVIFYLKWFRQNLRAEGPSRSTSGWLALSALALGITAASKYNYCIVGVVILIHYVITCIRQPIFVKLLPWIVIWLALSLWVFLFFDPYLWPDPVVRLKKSLSFNINYPGSPSVNGTELPFWQPLLTLSSPFSAYFPIPMLNTLITPDRLIFILALLGLPGFWKRENRLGSVQPDEISGELFEGQDRRSPAPGIYRFYPAWREGSDIYLIWLALGLVVLMAWPTKWPQYELVIMAPMCLSASQGARMAYNWVKAQALLRFRHAPG
jgi:hypothetical protein